METPVSKQRHEQDENKKRTDLAYNAPPEHTAKTKVVKFIALVPNPSEFHSVCVDPSMTVDKALEALRIQNYGSIRGIPNPEASALNMIPKDVRFSCQAEITRRKNLFERVLIEFMVQECPSEVVE